MAGDGGMAILVLGILYMLSKGKAPALNGVNGINGMNGGAPPFPYPDPETPEEAEVVTKYLIRTRRLIVHPTVIDIPTIPTVTQIDTAADRVKAIDEGIPTWVKKRWGTAQAVQTPGWTPKGEG